MTIVLTNPNASAWDCGAADGPVLACATPVDGNSLHIDLGWTFSAGVPLGKYKLTLGGLIFEGSITDGRIHLDGVLLATTGSGRLEILITDGPTFSTDVELDLPAIQTSLGLVRRLTNLGWYAGTDGVDDGRVRWAIRAFKRAAINRYTRNRTEPEGDIPSPAFFTALQTAYGAHPDDSLTSTPALTPSTRVVAACGIFGSRTYQRGRFLAAATADDRDPAGAGNQGVWAGVSAAGAAEPLCGVYTVYLRAFDPKKVAPFSNRLNLPQPIHMTQFVLFELGYWVVQSPAVWNAQAGTQTRISYTPNGQFDQGTMWAVRELQCHAKLPRAAVEDTTSVELRYLPRLLKISPAPLAGAARYAVDGRISGATNPATRAALQAWADGRLRCPVVLYASTDTANPTANGSDLTRIVRENLWRHDDHTHTAARVYAIDYSGFYALPATYGGAVSSGGASFPRPIVVGFYEDNLDGGPVSIPPNQTWASEHVEVRPQTMLGRGGNDGAGLSAAELSTFKVVRTSSHFECYAYFDCLNAYDDVTLSFGPCHWTLARCSGDGAPDQPRELPAFLAYVRATYPQDYARYIGGFGLFPELTWPLTIDGVATYNDRITVQTETDAAPLCGRSGTVAQRKSENRYGKSWHVFYRFQMACRGSSDLRLAMWDFTRIRIRDILDKRLTIQGVNRRVGDVVTSEKGVAMLLRWHIFRPAHLFRAPTPANPNYLMNVLSAVLPQHPQPTQARENAVLQQLAATGAPLTDNSLAEILQMTNAPQQGYRSHYALNLTTPRLSSDLNSFVFVAP